MPGIEKDDRRVKKTKKALRNGLAELMVHKGLRNITVRELTDKVQVLDGNVKDLQLTLENETNRNIRIIAEGHLDLNRKLDAALQTDSQKELMQLRVNILENDMRKVKEKVGIAQKREKDFYESKKDVIAAMLAVTSFYNE